MVTAINISLLSKPVRERGRALVKGTRKRMGAVGCVGGDKVTRCVDGGRRGVGGGNGEVCRFDAKPLSELYETIERAI